MKRINKKTPATASAVVFLVLLLMFTSCEKTTNPVEPKAKTGIGGLFAKSNDFYVYANLMTYTRESHYIGVDGEFVSTESVSQADFFKDGVAGAVDAGTVKHNGVALNKEAFQVSSGGSTYEYKNTTLRNQDVPLALDGSYQV